MKNDYAVLIAKVRHLALAGRNSIGSGDSGGMDSNNSSPEHNNRALSIVCTIASEAVAQSRQPDQGGGDQGLRLSRRGLPRRLCAAERDQLERRRRQQCVPRQADGDGC